MTDKRFPYEKLAKLESDKRRAAQPAQALVDVIADVVLRPDSVVLDVGVGIGYFAIPLMQSLPESRVIGLDVEPRMLEEVAQRIEPLGLGERIRLLEGAIDQSVGVDLVDDSIDVALLVNLYHELDDRSVALGELRRLLRPGGMILVCDWDPAGPTDFGPPKDHRISAETVEDELRASGFPECSRRQVYDHFYVLLAR